ncbi:hypothetical protein ACJX0J_019373, partial [Zea mays]
YYISSAPIIFLCACFGLATTYFNIQKIQSLPRFILHETIHELHRKKQSGVILKIDFEKAAKEDGQFDGLIPHLALISGVRTSFGMKRIVTFNCLGVESSDVYVTTIDLDFFWQGEEHRKKYRLAKWDIICQPKEQGGLGIQNIEIQNKRTLAKNKTISQVTYEGKGYLSRENKLDSGKIDTVANVFETIPLNISFRRALVGHNLVSWHSLVPAYMVHFTLPNFIFLVRNDLVFNKTTMFTYFQFYSKYAWSFSNRIHRLLL